MNDLEILKKARGYIARGWCQGAHGRDANGRPLGPEDVAFANDDRVVKVCIIGAIYRAIEEPLAYRAKDIIMEHLGLRDGRAALWNDTRGRTQVDALAIFDKAIEAAEAA